MRPRTGRTGPPRSARPRHPPLSRCLTHHSRRPCDHHQHSRAPRLGRGPRPHRLLHRAARRDGDSSGPLASRFGRTVAFASYSADELVEIVRRQSTRDGYECAPATLEALRRHFAEVDRGPTFGNGRYARTVLEQMMTRQAGRLVSVPDADMDQLRLLLPEDVTV
ncbi:hypothetical protein [Streptomyces sp. NBC_01363]|uniref:hypothetical protein n=1 Tax=Streptomyces sp. NBC_01363 TaxID=2903840 RepID=UPI002259A7FC|nr:hypothetical protein [Streptomyces sp. NBC_01363]MCX4736782.1 hypothetical protein [Streptomyces sp. NBC_01363]